MKIAQQFSTHDVDLAAFLMLEGLKYIEAVLDDKYTKGKPRVCLKFFDEKGIARDLEKVWYNSQMFKYRSLHRFLLKDIHLTLKGYK